MIPQVGYELTPSRVIQTTPFHKLATISRINQVTVNMELNMTQQDHTPPNLEQQPPHNAPSNLPKWLLPIFKTVLSILLPYLLSSPDISIHIHHINIMF